MLLEDLTEAERENAVTLSFSGFDRVNIYFIIVDFMSVEKFCTAITYCIRKVNILWLCSTGFFNRHEIQTCTQGGSRGFGRTPYFKLEILFVL